MAFQGNSFALLGGDDGDDVGKLLPGVAASAAMKAEEPQSTVEKRTGNGMKPLASSRQSSQFSSKPQRSFDHERGRGRGHVLERQNKNGVERHSRNGLERYDGQENGSRQNNRGGSSFKRNNGYGLHEMAVDGSKQYEGQGNGYEKKVGLTNDDGWEVVGRPNRHKQNNANGYQQRRGFGSSGYEVDDCLQAQRPVKVGGTERNYGWRRVFKGDNGSGRDVKVLKDEQPEGVSCGIVEKLTEANVNKNDKEYRAGNWSSGQNNRVNQEVYRGYGRGSAGEGKGGRERRGNKVSYQGYRVASAAEGKDNGKTSESTEFLDDKEVQKDSDNTNAGSEGGRRTQHSALNLFTTIGIDRDNAIAAEASKEPKKGKHNQVLSQEEAERLAEEELEAKRLTLKEYEKQLQEKRKVLESMKTQERRVTLDKDFESMHVIEKKIEETIFVKLNSNSDKLKKKVTMDKNDNNVPKQLVTNFKPARTKYSGRGDGRYHRQENGNGGYSGRREGTGNNHGHSRSAKKGAGTLPSLEDAKQFPALELGGSTKP